MIKFKSANDVFKFYYDYIQAYGYNRKDTIACFNISFEISFPDSNIIYEKFRNWKIDYAEKEWNWYMSGSRSVSEIKKYATIWDTMHKGDDLVWSNYGYWWQYNNQLEKAIQKLKDDPFTRRAIISHYDPGNIDDYDKDTPCNLILNFFILNNQLNLSIFARSIDLWFGFCNDQFMFSKLLIQTSYKLALEVGKIHYTITDFHIYNKHKNKNK